MLQQERIADGTSKLFIKDFRASSIESKPYPTFAARDAAAVFDISNQNPQAVKELPVDSVIVVMEEKVSGVGCQMSGKSNIPKTLSKRGVESLRKLMPDMSMKQTVGTSEPSRAAKNLQNMYVAKIEKGKNISEVIKLLNDMPEVEYAEPNLPQYLCEMPNDTYFYPEQWSLYNTGQTYHIDGTATTNGTPGADINWLSAWQSSNFPTGEIIIAIVDTGVDYTHFDIRSQMWINVDEIPNNGVDDDFNGYVDDYYGMDAYNNDGNPMDGNGHGTHVAGTAGAATENNYGIAGVCPSARIMAVKIFGDDGRGNTAAGIAGLRYAADMGAKVINCSWGGYSRLQSTEDAIKYAQELGASIVCAAGNSGVNYNHYPSGYDGVVAVAATDSDNNKAWFSNYGTTVDVSAPGVSILSLFDAGASGGGEVESNRFMIMNGTSMSSPCVAGAMGLFMLSHPGFSSWIYQKALAASCDDSIYNLPGNTNYIGLLGGGLLDIPAALIYNQTSAFVEAKLIKDENDINFYVMPGSTLYTSMRAGSWKHQLENVAIEVTRLTTGIKINNKNSDSYSIGTMAGMTELIIPENAFKIDVMESAELGSEQKLKVSIKSGSTELDSITLSFKVFGVNTDIIVPIDLEGDGDQEIAGISYYDTMAFNSDGSLLWFHQETGFYSAYAGNSLAAADIDGDGDGEVVSIVRGASPNETSVTVLDHNGNPVWRKTVPGIGSNSDGPVLADLDGDGTMEIIIRFGNSLATTMLRAYNYDGTVRWTKAANSSFGGYVLPAVGDIDGDGTKEVVALSTDKTVSYIHIFNEDGSLKNKFEIKGTLPGDAYFYRQPALGDLDLDGRMEIICFGLNYPGSSLSFSQGRNAVCVYDINGNPVDGWPKDVEGYGHFILQPPSIADIDKDGDLEISVISSLNSEIYAWHHDGTTVAGFPILDLTLDSDSQPLYADMNGDDAVDLVYAHDVQDNDFKVSARGLNGMLIVGFPITFDEEIGITDMDIFVDYLSPDSFGTNQMLAATVGDNLHVRDSGAPFNQLRQEWPMRSHDSRHSACYSPARTDLKGNFYCPERYGINTLTANFIPNVIGQNTNGMTFAWDFTNDGSIDSTSENPDFVYSSPGIYSPRLVVSNSIGETFTALRENYIHVLSPLAVDFSANVTNISAPAEISFTDLSSNMPQYWAWDFGDGGVSTLQHPSHIYTSSGWFSVSLTISNNFGDGGSDSISITKTDYIHIPDVVENVTTHYVSKTGTHIPPFKNWVEAATSIVAAAQVCSRDDKIIVNNGHYFEGATIKIDQPGVTLESVNGPLVTIIDGNFSHRVIYVINSNVTVNGFTVQRGTTTMGSGIAVGNPFQSISTIGSKIRNCIVKNNVGTGSKGIGINGGGIQIARGSDIENCVIISNKAWTGGGVHGYGIISNCVIQANEAAKSSSALWLSGGNLYNSLITHNVRGKSAIALFGSGMYNCTIVSNETYEGALANNLETFNNIFYYNKGGDYDNSKLGGDKPFLNNCAQQGNLDNANEFSAGNFTSPPQFLDMPNNNFRLVPASPCVDSGTNYVRYGTNVTPVRSARFDFGLSSNISSPNWNNVTNISTGLKIDDAVDTTGAATPFDLYITSPLQEIMSSYTIHADYPDSATKDDFATSTKLENCIRIANLSSDRQYTIKVLPGGSGSPKTIVYINNVWMDNLYYNELGVFEDIFPDLNGDIIIGLEKGSSSNPQAHISLLEITEIIPDILTVLDSQTDLDGNPRIYNNIVDVGCYEYGGNYPPTADFSVTPPAGTPVLTVNFSAENSYDYDGTITNYSWEFGDGSALSGPNLTNVVHDYSNIWKYVAKLTVADNAGKSDSMEKVIDVRQNVPKAPTNFSGFAVSPSAIELVWDDVEHETGYVISRGEQNGPPVDIILDQEDAGVTFWLKYSQYPLWPGTNGNPTAWGPVYSIEQPITGIRFDSRYRHSSGRDWFDASAEFRPDISEAGIYEIFEWHPKHSCNPARPLLDGAAVVGRNVKHIIHKVGGGETVFVNQRENWGQWNSLGTFFLEPGNFLEIDCANLYNEVGLMDGIRFVRRTDYLPIGGAAANATNYPDSGLDCDMSYTYYLKATNQYGSSPWVNTTVHIPTTNALPVAEIISINPTSGSPVLAVTVLGSGTDSDGTIVDYEWDFGDGYSGSIMNGEHLTNPVYNYYYPGEFIVSLTVTDDHGFSSTNLTVVNVNVAYTAPNAPSNLTATLTTPTSITLNWDDKAYTEDAFQIERKENGGQFYLHATVSESVKIYIDDWLDEGISYTYQIRATNLYGNSDWSNEATARTPILPEAYILAPAAATSVVAETEVYFLSEAISGDNAITNLQWNFGDGSINTNGGLQLTNIVHSYTVEGMYTAVFSVADSGGFGAEDFVEIEVIPEISVIGNLLSVIGGLLIYYRRKLIH